MTTAALEAGISVMVEKPMGMSPNEGEAMLAASRGSGAQLMVAHCWRFDKEVQWLRQQVTAGKLGNIVRTKSYGVHLRWGPTGWFTQKKLAGGGALVDMGIHALDTARFLLGDPLPVSVYAKVDTCFGTYDVDDTDQLMVTWAGGAVSFIESGWWQPHMDMPEAGTQLYGTKGFGQIFPSYLETTEAGPTNVTHTQPGFPSVRIEHCEQEMYDAQMAYFVDCVQQCRTPCPGGAEGLINMKILSAAYESSKTGKVYEF
jgi:predicted dehydrogenase